MIQIYEILEDADYYYLVTELFDGIDLIARVTDKTKPVTERFVAYVMHEIIKAIARCHAE